MLVMKTAKGAIWLVFSRFIAKFIDFFTLLVLARVLSPADFGTTTFAMTLIVIVDIVLELPMSQALLRLPQIDQSHFDTVFTLALLRSSVMTSVMVLLAWLLSILNNDSQLLPLVAVLAIGPAIKCLYSPAMIHFSRNLSFRQTFLTEVVGKMVAFVAAVSTLAQGGGYWSIVVNFVVAPIVGTALSYVLAPYRPALSLSRLTDFSSFIGWFSSAQILSALNWQYDRLLLGLYVDKSVLGRYAVSSDLAVLPTQSLIGPALQPVMAAFTKINTDQERLKLAFMKAARFAMLISVPVCVGISLTADLAVALVLGPKWQEAGPFLRVLALSLIAIPYFQTMYSFALAVDRPSMLFKLNLIDLSWRVSLISAGFVLLSVEGVLVARILIALIMFAFYLVYARELTAVSVKAQLRNIWKIAVAALAMAGSVLVLRHILAPIELNMTIELVLVACTGAIVYFGALLACGTRLTIGRGRLELNDRWW